MEMWQGAISSQITSVFPCRSDREAGGGGKGGEREKQNQPKAKGWKERGS